jgi:hypothetical protein
MQYFISVGTNSIVYPNSYFADMFLARGFHTKFNQNSTRKFRSGKTVGGMSAWSNGFSGLCPSPNIIKTKEHRFGNWICSRPQMER